MNHLPSFIRTAILAAAMAFGASPAFAGPMYHVTVDTSSVAATSTGLLDFALSNNPKATEPTTVTLTNFTGNFGAELDRAGLVSDIAGGYKIDSAAGLSWLTRTINLGGKFGFDVGFADSFIGEEGVSLDISLLDGDYNYLGLSGYLVEFDLMLSPSGGPSNLVVSPDNAMATTTAITTAVPEPSELLLMLTGLAMAGFITRRARKNAP